MTVQFDLPEGIERRLRSALNDFDGAVKEAALVELYRSERLTLFELAEALGITRLQAEGILKAHGVTEDLLTAAEHERQLVELRELGRK
ncbi:MAG TPA: UPF0175 family protein [Phycisphaerae bacterium]|nr:UPF0175 family protein [Phycisphaerae bacterium]